MSLLERSFGIQVSTASRLVQAAAAQRVRLGLTGLATVFLLVLAAAAGMKPAGQATLAGNPGEPLAVLGVAPGAGSAGLASNSQPRQVRRRPART